jgi:AcrR family transcriptional regulator
MAPTKKPNRLERRKLATREAILNVSRELIATDGVEHLSVNAVADQADVALGTFYNYLGDKASLFRTLAEDDCDTMRRAAGSIADGEPPATRLGWLVGVVAARACLDPVFAAYSHEMFRAGHLPHPHIQAELLWLYRRGVEAGQFTALPEPVAASVVGALPPHRPSAHRGGRHARRPGTADAGRRRGRPLPDHRSGHGSRPPESMATPAHRNRTSLSGIRRIARPDGS